MKTLIDGLLLQCQDLVCGALELAGLAAGEVDYVVHTGRTSHMPLVQRNLAALFPDLPGDRFLLDADGLKVCVARGAALYGAMRYEMADTGIRLEDAGRRLPHAYGVGKKVGLQRSLVFDEIIPIGAECPVARNRPYETANRWLQLRFFQNAGRKTLIEGNPDIKYLGQIQVDTLSDGVPGCQVRLVVDANRILEVYADGQPVKIEAQPMEDDERWVG